MEIGIIILGAVFLLVIFTDEVYQKILRRKRENARKDRYIAYLERKNAVSEKALKYYRFKRYCEYGREDSV